MTWKRNELRAAVRTDSPFVPKDRRRLPGRHGADALDALSVLVVVPGVAALAYCVIRMVRRRGSPH